MTTPPRLIFHLLPNAHLDPVWLWDWREGLNEGLTTVTTILDLMDEAPELTFIRGESSIYQHIQTTAPKVFARILAMIEAGRWDVVGGTYVQPDSNLSSTETLCRQFEKGLAYFDKELGVRPRISWQADSFGHAPGWPNVLRSFGMEGFTFTRPQQAQFALPSPAFWWECDHDDRLLCYRQHYKWYCSERDNMHEVLDKTLAGAASQPDRNVGVLMGLGNHGGGPSRRNLADVVSWGKLHPEVELRYSTLHRFFAALRAEIEETQRPVPSVSGDLGYCLRGCYSSVQKFKSLYRHAETSLMSAEISQSMIGHQLPVTPRQSLDEAWDAVLFNSFHDILPGSSIERAMEDQMAWTGLAIHHAQKAQFAALNALAERVDTQVPPPEGADQPADVPLLLWNPSSEPFCGQVELEASLDYRPIWEWQHRRLEMPFHVLDENGEPLPLQEIETEHNSMADVPWRKRAVVALEVPAFGWRVVRMGLAKEKNPRADSPINCRAESGDEPSITNGEWSVAVTDESLAIRRHGGNFFLGAQHFRMAVMEDPWGSWGGMKEEPDSYQLDQVREEWKITASEIVESGPERASLWTRWEGAHSWAELTFFVARDTPGVKVHGRLLWNERSARLQLILPSTGPAKCDVPGSVAVRQQRGQVPVGRWFQRQNSDGGVVGIASDVLSDADFLENETRLTLARASRYADDQKTGPTERRTAPAVDCGELKFRLNLYADGVTGDQAAHQLLNPLAVLAVTPGPGDLPRQGSFGSLQPAGVRLLSVQKVDGHLHIRVQNRNARSAETTFQLGGVTHSLGLLGPQQIVTRSI
ncbi:MAG: hypothetical protein ABIT76_05020 [Chthoniobacterales bacterium]